MAIAYLPGAFWIFEQVGADDSSVYRYDIQGRSLERKASRTGRRIASATSLPCRTGGMDW